MCAILLCIQSAESTHRANQCMHIYTIVCTIYIYIKIWMLYSFFGAISLSFSLYIYRYDSRTLSHNCTVYRSYRHSHCYNYTFRRALSITLFENKMQNTHAIKTLSLKFVTKIVKTTDFNFICYGPNICWEKNSIIWNGIKIKKILTNIKRERKNQN